MTGHASGLPHNVPESLAKDAVTNGDFCVSRCDRVAGSRYRGGWKLAVPFVHQREGALQIVPLVGLAEPDRGTHHREPLIRRRTTAGDDHFEVRPPLARFARELLAV